jgi:hypothetical protein
VTIEVAWFYYDEIIYLGPEAIVNPQDYYTRYNWNYAFYDKQTGEVWGKRVATNLKRQWRYYSDGRPPLPLILLDEIELLPDSAFEFLLNWMIQEKCNGT